MHCFNPRTRMGCDEELARLAGLSPSFNPRTRMGCDYTRAQRLHQVGSFNPRTRMGCDFKKYCVQDVVVVSIHAPAWGATFVNYSSLIVIWCFNPRTRMGCDMLYTNNLLKIVMFQSTHPHGVRLTQMILACQYTKFQSTHPHGVRR